MDLNQNIQQYDKGNLDTIALIVSIIAVFTCSGCLFASIVSVVLSIMVLFSNKYPNKKKAIISICLSFISVILPIIVLLVLIITAPTVDSENVSAQNDYIEETIENDIYIDNDKVEQPIANAIESDIDEEIETEEIEEVQEDDENILKKRFNDEEYDHLSRVLKKCDVDENKISKVEKLSDWANGKRYCLTLGFTKYYVYFYDNGEVSSINLNSLTGKHIYEDGIIPNDIDNIIVIKDGFKGKYGQEDLFDGESYIRYYLPTGKYIVRCQTRGSGFYIESIKTHKEDGFDTTDVYENIKFNNVEESYEIEIKEGQCIFTFINSILEFEPIE